MLTSLAVENFRGFERLEVENLGRMNLIVGRNESGKTSLMAAAALAPHPAVAVRWARHFGHARLAPTDYERVWRPLWRGGEVERAIRLRATVDGVSRSWALTTQPPKAGSASVEATLVDSRGHSSRLTLDSTGTLTYEQVDGEGGSPGWWSGPYPDPEEDLQGLLAAAYRQGRSEEVHARVREVFPHVLRVDVVGSSVYVVLEGYALPLPVSVLGDGARRLVEFAAASVRGGTLYLDEVENGFHWSTLGKLWALLRRSAVEQLFATTHREENVRIACETFRDAGDDGLRVIRVDRLPSGHVATVYTAEEALTSMDLGLDVRG